MLLVCSPLLTLPAAAQRETEAKAPFIAYLFPAGGQRGQTVEATVSGINLDGTTAVRVTGAGVKATLVKIVDPKNVQISAVVAPDAELGEHDLRLITANGVSNRFRFIVGELPEIKEVEPNSDKNQPQRIESLPVLVNGQIMEADRDYYRFAAKAGQTLVCEVQARRLLPFITGTLRVGNETTTRFAPAIPIKIIAAE